MVQAIKDSAELMNKRLSRRGYYMEDSKNVMQKRKGNLIYLKKRSVSDRKRFY